MLAAMLLSDVVILYFERLKGRKSLALKDMESELLILELKDGKVYGGALDEYYYKGGGIAALYSCQLLDKKNLKWVDHDRMMEFEGKLIPDTVPDFYVSEIKNILVLREEFRDKLSLEDMLQIYIDPYYKPLPAVECHWQTKEAGTIEVSHNPECDARLHEALSFLLTEAESGVSSGSKQRDKARERRLSECFRYVRRRLLTYGAKIP